MRQPSDDLERVIRETLVYARVTLDALWAAGRTTKSIDIEPALAAAAELARRASAS